MKRNLFFFCLFFAMMIQPGYGQMTENAGADLEKSTPGEQLFFEPFDHLPQGFIPTGWSKEGDGQQNWGAYNMDNAGGEAPQMRFYIHPIFEGTSFLLTPFIDIQDSEGLIFSFKNRINNFSGLFNNDKVAVDYSFNGGTDWEELWSYVVSASRGPEELNLYFEAPGSAENVQFRFRFEGNSGNLHMWSFDDVTLTKALQQEVYAGNVSGNTLPVAQKTSSYKVNVFNAGLIPMDDYTVRLLINEETEIASLQGTGTAFGESVEYEFQWTPDENLSGRYYLSGVVEWTTPDGLQESATEPFEVHIQPAGSGTSFVGTDDVVSPYYIEQPFDFNVKTSLSQTIYYPEEMDVIGGKISRLVYFNHFDHAQYQEVKIYMGTTSKEHLFEGYISTEEHQLVFEGTVYFPEGANTIVIPLDEPYLYEGGEENLVVTNLVPMHDNASPPYVEFYVTATDRPYRARAFRSNETTIDPEHPPAGGEVRSVIPNTVFVFDGENMGTLSGNATTLNGDPLKDVMLRIQSTGATTTTNEGGDFYFPLVPEGSLKLEVFKTGYYEQEHDLLITNGQEEILDAQLENLPLVAVEGTITVSDQPGTPLPGAKVNLHGNASFSGETDENGKFQLDAVFGDQPYLLSISAEGYNKYKDSLWIGAENLSLDTLTLIETAHPAFNVNASVIETNDKGNAAEAVALQWEAAGSAVEKDFRYDSGFMEKVFGVWPCNLNTVYGNVHPYHAQLNEISWFLGSETSVYPTIKVWVIGLDEEGWPDHENIIYTAENVPNQQRTWNTYQLSEPLLLENGFLVGISTSDWIGLALDNGSDENYPFQPLTQFFTDDIAAGSPFLAFEEEFPQETMRGNFMIRAHGLKYGPAIPQAKGSSTPADTFVEVDGFHKEDNIQIRKGNSKALEHYHIYRLQDGEQDQDPAQWDLLAEGLNGLEFTDHDWDDLEAGAWVYAVVAEYTNENLSQPAFSNMLSKDMHIPVSIEVTTNTGAEATGARVDLVHSENPSEHQYSAIVPPSGLVEFPMLWRGYYDLSISLEGYENYQVESLDLTEPIEYQVELLEEILKPDGLMIFPDKPEAGKALFKWNTAQLLRLFQHDDEVPEEPNAYYQTISNVYGTVFDLSEFPDAVLEFANFHHLQWDVTISPYAYKIHVVDWETFSIIESIGPFETEQANNWEEKAELGSLDASEYSMVGVMIQPLSVIPGTNHYYPTITGDANGTNGLSVTTPLENLEDYVVNPYSMGDFLINLWISTTYGGGEMVRATQADQGSLQAIETRGGWSQPKNPDSFTQIMTAETGPLKKSNPEYSVFLNNMEQPLAENITEEEFVFTGLEPGEYIAGVKSVYTSGSSEIATIDFTIFPGYRVLFHVKNHEGQPVENATVTFDETQMDPGVYKIENVKEGEYPFFVSKEGFFPYEGEVTVIDQDVEMFVELQKDATGLNSVPESQVVVFPNPARNHFYIKADNRILQVRFFDSKGQSRITLFPRKEKVRIDALSLESGVYFVEILTKNGLQTKKVQIFQ